MFVKLVASIFVNEKFPAICAVLVFQVLICYVLFSSKFKCNTLRSGVQQQRYSNNEPSLLAKERMLYVKKLM